MTNNTITFGVVLEDVSLGTTTVLVEYKRNRSQKTKKNLTGKIVLHFLEVINGYFICRLQSVGAVV